MKTSISLCIRTASAKPFPYEVRCGSKTLGYVGREIREDGYRGFTIDGTRVTGPEPYRTIVGAALALATCLAEEGRTLTEADPLT